MGKRLKSQKRGKGSPRYLSPKTRYKAELQYRSYDDLEKTGALKGQVLEFVDDPSRGALLMRVKYDNGEEGHLLAPEGICLRDTIEIGAQASVSVGNVLPLYRIPDGSYIFNLELSPGDGGKLVRAPGSYALLVSKEGPRAFVKLPSKKVLSLSTDSRAQVGVVCGGGRSERPMLKAGVQYYKKKAQNKLWPKPRGVHQSAYSHPHGGKQHHEGKPTTVSAGTPAGRKVGHLAARSTGRKKARKAAKGES